MIPVILIYDCGCVYDRNPITPIVVKCHSEKEVDNVLLLGGFCAPIYQCRPAPYTNAFIAMNGLECIGEHRLVSYRSFVTLVKSRANDHLEHGETI